MIILSDENLKYVFDLAVTNFTSFHGKTIQQNTETCIGYSQMFSANDSSMNGTWNIYLYTAKKEKTKQNKNIFRLKSAER